MNVNEAITQGVARATAPPLAVSSRQRVETADPAPAATPAPAPRPTLPPVARATADAFAARRNENLRAGSRLKIDESTKRVVVEILNSKDEIIRQVPPEELLRITARLRNVVGQFFDQSA